jgi:hypothetical protein
MKKRRSGSEQGLCAEVVRFFNLVSGASGSRSSSSSSAAAESFADDNNSSSNGFSSSGRRSRRFWLDVAAPAVEARYGAVALEQEERDGLFEVRCCS